MRSPMKRYENKTMKALPIISVTLILLVGCSPTPEVSFKPEVAPDGLQFELGSKNVNGFSKALFWEKDSGKMLWDVDLKYFPGPTLKYGELPSGFTTFGGNRGSAEQRYPQDAAAVPIPMNKVIYVRLGYQYDHFVGASSGTSHFAFQLDNDGTITDFGEQPYRLRKQEANAIEEAKSSSP